MKKFFRWAVVFLAAAGFCWFLRPVFHNVLDIGDASGMTVCAIVFLAALFHPLIQRAARRHAPVRIAWRTALILFCLGIVWSAFLSVLMASQAAAKPPEGATVLVLGSKVSGDVPSADLRVRIETAQAYLKANPKAVCVACGGQGPGENASEAVVIHRELTAGGIEASRVLEEDHSTSTQQNIANALKIIRAKGLSTNLALVTDDYHEYRACSIARRQGVQAWAIPARTPDYIFSACWARELLALTRFLLLPV